MTWITRVSLLESADDLDLGLAGTTLSKSAELWNEIVYEGVNASNPWHRMWDGYETALAAYVCGVGVSLAQRGVHVFKAVDSVVRPITDLRQQGYDYSFVLPPWIGDLDFIRSHRSNLLRRYPERFEFKGTPAGMPMLWPFVDDEGGYELMISKHDKSLLANGERSLPSKIAERVSNL